MLFFIIESNIQVRNNFSVDVFAIQNFIYLL